MDGSFSPTPPPAIDPRLERTGVLIVGAGFSGLGMAIKLREAGERDFLVLDKEAGVGGTWRVNQYPGCACDVQSHLYSFSFAPNPRWSRMFSGQPEIRAYLEGCVERFGLGPHLRLGTEMESAVWDAPRRLWVVHTVSGKRYEAPVLVPAVGGLSRPSVPELKGLSRFKGRVFHSQQWDHSVNLAGKRVAVIGTGASAIQFVPQIQPAVARIDLYQRTPPWVLPKPDRRFSALEQTLFASVPGLQKLVRGRLYSALEVRALAFVVWPEIARWVQKLGERHLAEQVPDPVLRARLTPDYRIGCKRVLISNDYYPALSQPNVAVVTDGVAEVRARSIVDAAGVEREVDVIVLGTGFQATTPVPQGVFFGRNGVDLGELWQKGPEAYKGTAIHGFPNLFMLTGPNTGLGHNSVVYMIESQLAYVMDALRTLRANRLASVEVKQGVQARFNARLQAKLRETVWEKGGCSSWYVHQASGKNTTLWPDFTFAFRAATKRFDLGAYDFTVAAPAAAGASMGKREAAASD